MGNDPGHIVRAAAAQIAEGLRRRESMLLLGPRQVGKTTLIQHVVKGSPNVLMVNLLRARDRDRYAVDPDLLLDETSARLRSVAPDTGPLIVVVDEVQRVPALLDAVQLVLDEHKGRVVCLLSGSSARKLRRGKVNLLRGRITRQLLYPLSSSECTTAAWSVNNACRFGRLPGIVTMTSNDLRRRTLEAYVATYLQEASWRQSTRAGRSGTRSCLDTTTSLPTRSRATTAFSWTR
jgi:predicted AAA+ superfamily ATPase